MGINITGDTNTKGLGSPGVITKCAECGTGLQEHKTNDVITWECPNKQCAMYVEIRRGNDQNK